MKRLVTLMVVGAMAALLAGCGQQAPKQTDIKPTTTTETTEATPAAEPAAEAAPAAEAEKPADEQAAPAANQE